MEEPSYAALQREVQRQLGRCLIRIQQYELLLKEFVAKREIAGEMGEITAQLAENVSTAAGRTMGSLVGELTERYFQPTLLEQRPSQAGDGPAVDNADTERPAGWARFQMYVAMAPDAYASLKAELQDLVDMRNDLVHHFVEGQDLCSEEGCIAAEMYLVDCYSEIDRHLGSLRAWATSMNEAKLVMASFMNSPEYLAHLMAGLSPAVDPGEAALPIFIDLLQRAEAEQSKDGWVALNSAIAFAKMVAPEVSLAKHSYGSWRQVLHEARKFEVRRLAVEPGGPVETWYRSRS